MLATLVMVSLLRRRRELRARKALRQPRNPAAFRVGGAALYAEREG